MIVWVNIFLVLLLEELSFNYSEENLDVYSELFLDGVNYIWEILGYFLKL